LQDDSVWGRGGGGGNCKGGAKGRGGGGKGGVQCEKGKQTTVSLAHHLPSLIAGGPFMSQPLLCVVFALQVVLGTLQFR